MSPAARTPRLALALALAGLAAAACAVASRPELDPDSRSFYETARLVLTGEEQDIFLHLPDEASRREFIADFWDKRDPDPDTEVNEFKREFEARLAYADAHFREGRRGVNTDRGRIYVYLGPPEQTDYYPAFRDERGMGPILLWGYDWYDIIVQFQDPQGTGAFAMTEVQGNLMQAIEEAKLGAIFKGGGERRPLRFDLRYDPAAQILTAAFPVARTSFKEEDGVLKTGFDLTFYVYRPGQAGKDRFERSFDFEARPEAAARMKEMTFAVPYALPPGKCYVDVVAVEKDGSRKARRIFALRG